MSTPSSPTTSPANPPPSSTGTSSTFPGVSPAGSPPLILAFLAIGIFSAAMIAVFGWRRVQYGRGAGFWRSGDTRRSGARIPLGPLSSYYTRFGDKPVLWDLWTDRNSTVAVSDHGSWDNIMPLSVEPQFAGRKDQERNPAGRNQSQNAEVYQASRFGRSPINPPVVPSTTATLPTGRPVPQSVLLYRVLAASASSEPSTLPPLPPPPTVFQRLTTLVRRALPIRPNRDQRRRRNVEDEYSFAGGGGAGGGGGGRTQVEEEPKDVRVSVIIEMPSRATSALRNRLRIEPGQQVQQPRSGKSMDMAPPAYDPMDARLGDDMNEIFQYCIGAYVSPWPSLPPPSKNRR